MIVIVSSGKFKRKSKTFIQIFIIVRKSTLTCTVTVDIEEFLRRQKVVDIYRLNNSTVCLTKGK
jgi:hypothetical protein